VRKADEAERKRVDADAKRERRRRERTADGGEPEAAVAAVTTDETAPEAGQEGGENDVGRLIDTRA
jgi:hypothetical protein